jgi:nucleotide-binding universal stress UspA family protein
VYRAIIVPVDGSSLAERALPYAERIARAGEARLVILQVVHPASNNASDEEVAAQADEVVAAQTHVDALVGRVAPGVAVEGAVTINDPAEGILEETNDRQAGLIVMSTHGRSGIGRWIYGSVADDVMRHARVPVLLVPPHIRLPWPTDRRLRVLVPLDGSDLARGSLPLACELVDALQAELFLVRSVELHPPMYGDPTAFSVLDPTLELDAAKSQLEKLAVDLRATGWTVHVDELVGYAVTAITDFARDHQIDVIAMSTHGSGGITRLIMGSVATGIVQRAESPVLVVRQLGS